MEEILASIRRIIADDDANKAAVPPEPAPAPPAAAAPARPAPPPPRPVAPPPPPPAPPPAAAMNQAAVDAMLADIDPPRKPAPAPAPDILDLTEAQATPNFRTIDGASDVVFAERPPEKPPEPVARAVDEAKRQFAQLPDRGLLSSAAASAVDSAFNSLANTVIGQNSRTLEDLVREMLRPMLKSWLDDNLPGLVERIVRAEIERVSRGR